MTQKLDQKARDNMHKPGFKESALYARIFKIRKLIEEIEEIAENRARKELNQQP